MGRIAELISHPAIDERLPSVKPPFEQVVQQHGAAVLRVCRALAASSADAEDVWSETFLAALRAYPELDGDANVEAWLVTIARRKAIDASRRAARSFRVLEQLPDSPAATPSPSDEVWDAVRTLPEKQRLAVAYRYLAGLPYREIADQLGGTEAAARRAAADGMRSLRRTLAPTGRKES